MMRETQAQLDEEQKKRDRAERDRLKREHESHAAALKEQMRLDYIERFGCEPPEEKEENKQKVAHYVNALKKNHASSNPAGLKTCLNTLKVYTGNAKNNPLEEKFKKIKKENKAFQERVAPFPEALELLDVMGFKD